MRPVTLHVCSLPSVHQTQSHKLYISVVPGMDSFAISLTLKSNSACKELEKTVKCLLRCQRAGCVCNDYSVSQCLDMLMYWAHSHSVI